MRLGSRRRARSAEMSSALRLAASEAAAREGTFAPAVAGAKGRVGEHQVEAARRRGERAAAAQIGAYGVHHAKTVQRRVARG